MSKQKKTSSWVRLRMKNDFISVVAVMPRMRNSLQLSTMALPCV